MSICDLLFSADMLVPDPRGAVEQLVASIGLPRPGSAAYVEYPEEGWDCVFALVNKSFRAAPTRLEVIGPKTFRGRPEPGRGQRISDLQGNRPCKTHATVLATPDIEALVRKVRDRGLRHWAQPPTAEVPFWRLWMGVTEDAPASYQGEGDAGLMIEVIPSDSPAFPGNVLFETPPESPRVREGTMGRIVSRAFLVADLDETLRTLDRNLGWEPVDEIACEPESGTRRVSMSRNLAKGGALELIQPGAGESGEGRFMRRWGEGPYAIRIAVAGLDAMAEGLERRGTSAWRLAASRATPERLVVDETRTCGMPFEFVESGEDARSPSTSLDRSRWNATSANLRSDQEME
jgi:hypothetical protein